MGRYRIVIALACVAAAGCTGPPAVPHTTQSGPSAVPRTEQARAGGAVWSRAIEVPGLGTLNAGGETQVSTVSCASAGNCAVGGFYLDRSRHSQAWVDSQVNGRWGTAIEVPGTAALNADGFARVSSVACGSAGNCTAGGFYADGSGSDGTGHWRFQAFVASQRNGRWNLAIEVPGTAALDVGGAAGVTSVACARPGNCAVGGFYNSDSSLNSLSFVASQRNGRWGTAIQMPSRAALKVAGDTQVSSVACAPAGNCTAGGSYEGRHGSSRAFVASQRNGRWDIAILKVGGFAAVRSVSCASSGICAAGGIYNGGSGHLEAFVAIERDGRWGTAIEAPGTATLNAGGEAQVNAVSCNQSGSCTAGGSYKHSHGPTQGFVVSWS